MKITKTIIMHALIESSDYGTIKVLEPPMLTKISDFYGESAVQKIEKSGLYERESYSGDLYLTACNLSANIFEVMPNILTEGELADHIAQYMKDNEMWPTERPIDEIVRYTVEVALPRFVNAGLLNILY